MVTAALLYLFSWRRGLDVQRLVLVGIGLGATLTAGTSYLLVNSRIQDAASAQVWLSGSLTARGWEHVASGPADAGRPPSGGPAAGPVASTPCCSATTPPAAWGSGSSSPRSRCWSWRSAWRRSSVAAVGPLEFVAFVVPQVALRLTRGSRPPVLASMVAGAILVVGADLVTRAVLPFALPAGHRHRGDRCAVPHLAARPHQPQEDRMNSPHETARVERSARGHALAGTPSTVFEPSWSPSGTAATRSSATSPSTSLTGW